MNFILLAVIVTSQGVTHAPVSDIQFTSLVSCEAYKVRANYKDTRKSIKYKCVSTEKSRIPTFGDSYANNQSRPNRSL